MNTRHHDDDTRRAAMADYYAGTETYAVVAARHGVPRSTLAAWCICPRDQLAYVGGWEVRGGVSYPLAPKPRSA